MVPKHSFIIFNNFYQSELGKRRGTQANQIPQQGTIENL